MNASDLLFPIPRAIRPSAGTVRLPPALSFQGTPIPKWLCRRLAHACRTAGTRLTPRGGGVIRATLTDRGFSGIHEERLRDEAYRLTLDAAGHAIVTSPAPAGLRHGLITLSLLFEAAGTGARLSPLVIDDYPAFAVRGFQIDMAREYFPSVRFLKNMIDRAADLKFNTLWLYLENHFRAPGLEDISPPGGMTPESARELSAYAAARGVDLVPGTNVLSHMEGWFRLERYSDFVDGAMRSYPVLTRPEAWKLVRSYLDALAAAFPSPNFHAGLDELLFTGTNPEAAKAIAARGKAVYFADFACKVINHLQKVHGKTVWMWDDMVLGKNIYRPEGFNDTYLKALNRFPRDVIMTHWYYWTNSDGKHQPIMKRVADAKRPFVVAPSSLTCGYDFGSLSRAADNQSYMARCGLKNGAFGLVNTQWENRYGCSFLAGWPLQAMAAGFAWSGGNPPDSRFWNAFSFGLCGDQGELVRYLEMIDRIQDLLSGHGVGPAAVRGLLFLHGPQRLWRQTTTGLTPTVRRQLRTLLATARKHHAAIGNRDPKLKRALALGVTLFSEGLTIIDAFDKTWGHYHRASLLERKSGSRAACSASLKDAIKALSEARSAMLRLNRDILTLERTTGHTSYDSYAIGEWIKALDRIPRLIREVAQSGGGLPYFEKLLSLPSCYELSNLQQIRVQNTFHDWFAGGNRSTQPPKRWQS